tara:strand:- start:3628 stop:4491 length:864 start_codon:yes stop_codon:yes gene_type:complete
VNWQSPKFEKIIDNWIEEDLGYGDLTKPAISQEIGEAIWTTKKEGTFCGESIIRIILRKIDRQIETNFLIKDGEEFGKNQKILELKGPTHSLLSSERITLNIAMHLSGIATYTKGLTKKLANKKIKLADTRKTTPGLRFFEKYAFRCGGGINHRMGLYDAAMIKENHLAWCNDLKDSINRIRIASPFTTHIIVEAESINQAKEAIIAGADSILLDEIKPEKLKESILDLRNLATNQNRFNNNKRLLIEISGIDPNKIEDYLIDGIDFISTSAATTKSSWSDFSMRYI